MRWSPAFAAVAGTGALALAAVAGWSRLLLVVQERVVPGWGMSAASLVLALALRRALTRRSRRAGAAELPRKQAGWVRQAGRLLIGVAVLGIAWGAVDDLVSGAKYYVLRPAGPDGCTAVVRETSFLVIGSGEVYAVGRTGLAVGTAGHWTVDDNRRPVEEGAYELTWGRDGGRLRVDGATGDPVFDGGAADVDC
ncbi:hypothetical protein ABZ490_47830 [Streptomyces sp. NPDC005811]|uniref:hypothetical protein n=1 Tax=Streptomyces sp. NPDC005811 TaxID=3154565 RepID=UPI0033D132B6